MKKPVCFFVQNNYVERITVPVAQFAHASGICLEDRSSTALFDTEACGIDWSQYGYVLPVGSVQFLRELKSSPSLGQFIQHDDVSFAATTWQSQLGSLMLNEVGQLVQAGAVPAMLASALHHVRPNAEDKAFHAKVFDLEAWTNMRQERGLADDLPCWASPVQLIEAEWRCWLIGRECVEISQYRLNGNMERKRGAPPDIIRFAENVARRWLPAECVVMDIALTAQGPKVLEFNPIHGSGWYAADVHTILSAWLAWVARSVRNAA